MAGNIKARRETLYLFFASLLLATSCTSMPGDSQRAGSPGLEKIQHVIVIYQENWSFDGL